MEEAKLNNKVKSFAKKFSYTVTSNLFSMLISVLVVAIVPKMLGVEEYGYFQLYLFYATYVGLLHFGWNDGIYLRYGGKKYEELNKQLFFSQFWMLFGFQIIISGLIYVYSMFFIDNYDRAFIFEMIAICMILTNVRFMLLYILQGTYRIKEYAKVNIIGRIFYGAFILIFALSQSKQYSLIIYADVAGRSISLLYGSYCCKDIVFRRLSSFYFSFKEAYENISVGIKLMFANIASLLIIGTVRFGIERSWDVSTFGKVSLILSASNLMMIFINAVGIIMFPILRRTNEEKLPNIYVTITNVLGVLLFGVLIVYYPLKVILSAWLPKYADSLMYMALVFPMCVYEGKMALLINTYLKTLRKEKLILKINLITLFLSLVITSITTLLLKNLTLAVASIVILLAFRCILAEIMLSKNLGISVHKDIILELMMTLIFILTGWFVNSWITILLYAIAYALYFIIKRKDIISTIKNMKLLLRS